MFMASAQEHYEKGLAKEELGQFEQAYIDFRIAAEKGHAGAQFRVGKYCLEKAEKNGAQAFDWLQKALAQDPDNADVNYQLSRCYEARHGTAKNVLAEVYHLSRAAELGNADAQARLGERYMEGDEVEKDAEKALEWLEKAIAQDPTHIVANYALGRYYDYYVTIHGETVDYEYQLKALDHYICAAERGHIEAMYSAGISVVCYPPEVKLEWLKKVVEKDPRHALAWTELADLYRTEEFFNSARAFRCYMTAAELGYTYAQYNVGLYYLNGWGGAKKDPKLWVEWLKKAINAGHPFACWDLGEAYECGLHGLKADEMLALKFYRKGCDLGLQYNRDRCRSRYNKLCEKHGLPGLIREDDCEEDEFFVEFPDEFSYEEPAPAQEEPEKPALARLEALIGLDEVKQKVTSIISMQKFNERIELLGRKPSPISMHMVFTGNPGTGKTTVARLIGEIFREQGILSTGQYVEAKRDDLVGEYIGQTAPKTRAKIEEARGGVLFIDEAYTLYNESERDFGREAVATLLTAMEDYRDDLVVIAAGYGNEMQQFIDSNPGLQSRFKNTVHFPDYDVAQLCQLFHKAADDENYQVDAAAEPLLADYFERLHAARGNNFGNAREVRNFFQSVLLDQTVQRLNDQEKLTLDDFVITQDDIQAAIDKVTKEPSSEAEEKSEGEKIPAMERLSAMVGLESVKDDIRTLQHLAAYRQLRKKCGKPMSEPPTMHMVFTGNPGTGKTTVAEMVGEIYHEFGLLARDHVVTVKRGDLVGEFVGQTAPKTKKVIEQAMGGVLFIDEAYTLNQGGEKDFGQEAVATLLAEMEERRDSLAVIVAGYEKEMWEFINMNPGLKSRFTKRIRFEDYDGEELAEIFHHFAEKDSYTYGEGAEEELGRVCEEMYRDRDRNFGNARDVRNLFDAVVNSLADRVGSREDASEEELLQITKEDVLKAEEQRKRSRAQEPKAEKPRTIGFSVDG